MSDDWQETALTTRHMHNRVQDRHSNNKRRTSSSTFDVRKTFASYTLKCPAWRKLCPSATDDEDGDKASSPRLEIYRLTESGTGVVGYLRLPGVMDVAVVLAGSRVALRGVVEAVEGGDEEDGEEDEDEDEEDEDRFETFEKNSFRSPKFWVRWSGGVSSNADSDSRSPSLGAEEKARGKGKTKEEDNDVVATGLGYIVFSGNTCAKFKGTLNCTELGWKDITISGHKIAGRSESDVPVLWGNGVEL